MLQITEDTPPDMLAGAMDLTVHLPNGRSVKMSVKRSMPMMDLLMHIATIHNLQLSEHTLEALSMAPSPDHIDKFLPFKPNTPIGVIDTQHIKVLPKPKPIVKQRMAPQPFESTFRLKVHLPRNQLYVTRVSRNVLLENILKKACEEKNLDWKKYALHHPGNLDEVLDPKLTLNDYQITEVYLVAKGTVNLNQAFSASDLMILRKEEERKRMQAKTGGGVLSLIFGRNNNKSSMGSGSLSSENRSISPTHSDDSRSVTPPAIPQQIITPPPKQDPEKPKPPQRKRRPAPKPPTNNERKNSDVKPASNISDNSDVQEQKADNNLTICHSRNSSDSSGYHEASILSDNCNTSLPRRPQSALIGSANVNNLSKQHSQSTTNLSKMSSHSKSTSSLAFAGRKKKAAPPPPPGLKSSTSVTNLALPSPVVASQAPASIPPAESLTSTNYTQATPFDSLASHLSSSEINSVTETSNTQALESPVVDLPAEDNKVEETIKSEPTIKPSSKITSKEEETVIEPEPIVAQIEIKTETPQFDETDKSSDIEAKEVEWQYQLPPPPEGFRDNNNYIEASTTQNATIKSDSVVTSPELFEKLKVLEDNQSEPGTIDSTVSEEEKPVINTNLSLENLEKRKSLVYNRELATSLKMTDKNDSFTTSLNKFESTYEEIRRSSLTRDYSQEPKFQPTVKRSTSTLPNFKIATYDNPKKNITVFEDDTVRSNTDSVLKKNIFNESKTEIKTNLTKSYIGRSMENISFRKNSWGNQSDDDKSKTKETGLSLYRPQSMMASKNSFGPSSMHRSESFSTEKHWSPTKPVSRSKSQLTLNKYKEEKATYKSLEPITKSNSLLDVSGLQSIGVMKLIQNRLKTPTTSLENVNHQEKLQQSTFKPIISSAPEVKEKPVNTYQYRGPPSINLSTWSERPKAQVTLKEDNDYKIKNVSSKLIVNTTNNNITSNNRIEVNNSHKYDTNYNSNGSVNVRVGSFQVEPKNVTIKVNGTEPISSENSGNVVIKIGSNNTQNGVGPDNQRFISHTTAIGYRRPLGNVNKFLSQRPHSIAVDSDISHVPVVRSVELKKPYRDMNTSITQIYQTNPLRTNTHNRNSYDSKNEVYKSTENISQTESKPVTRVNSMIRNFTPVVRGFNNTTENNFNNNNRYSTTSPNIYTVNKPKENDNFSTNKDVPFSQSNLRRTESNKIINAEPKYQSDSKINFINKKNSDYNFYAVNKPDVIQPPPPPMMPKMEIKKRPRQIEPKEDPRDQLLNAIRNFGGKKGLKSVKS